MKKMIGKAKRAKAPKRTPGRSARKRARRADRLAALPLPGGTLNVGG